MPGKGRKVNDMLLCLICGAPLTTKTRATHVCNSHDVIKRLRATIAERDAEIERLKDGVLPKSDDGRYVCEIEFDSGYVCITGISIKDLAEYSGDDKPAKMRIVV
jgi:hypothetical protein